MLLHCHCAKFPDPVNGILGIVLILLMGLALVAVALCVRMLIRQDRIDKRNGL